MFKGFVENFMKVNNIKESLDDVIGLIVEKARKNAMKVNNASVDVFDENEVEKIILDSPKLLAEMKKQKEKVETPKPIVKVATTKVDKPKSQPQKTKTTQKNNTMPDSEFDFEELGLF